tara:strand:- start:3078 stop:4361 length:1284 start_codon:yes stop_codon:yes gene_type:complete
MGKINNKVRTFKQYNEAKKKEVIFTFGRFNPPTTGHEKLMNKLESVAAGDNYKIYASLSNDPKKNPLQYEEKVKIMRKMFPKHGRNIILNSRIKNVFDIATSLYNEGYTRLVMVVGSDRVSEFRKLLNKYAGVKARHGFYEFSDGIDVVSAGERDPDAEGVKGMSASKMRSAAATGDFKSFSLGLPRSYGEDMTLFNLLRKRMGLDEMVNFRKHVQLPKLSDIREKYVAGEIFNVGDIVFSGITEITISERKTNFVVDTKGKKHFINSLSEVRQDKDVKDRKGTQPAKYYAKDAEGDEMSKSTKASRARHFEKGTKKSDDDPSAYKPAPGDASAKTKPSKYTKKFKNMFGETLGEDIEKGIQNKADKTGISYSILKKVFDRGFAAWKTGHRPGTTPEQWGYARINSFATGGKTRTTADADLWKKHKG